MRRAPLAFCALLAATPSAPAADYSAALPALEDEVRREMNEWKVGGIAVGLVDDQRVVYAAGFGEARRDSIFRVGSISKLFNAIALSIHMKLELHDLHLPMRHPFTIAHGTTTTQHNLLVKLQQDGITGHGEGASCDAYPEFTADSMRAALEAVRSEIESQTLSDPVELWDRLLPVLGHNRFALCALDEAAHDLWGKLRGAPVWRLWGLELRNLPLSNYTIGIDPVEKMVAKMKEFEGWPIYKIKLGTADDLGIIRELRRHTQAVFRVDANTAWSADQAIAFAPELKRLGVEFIEQPLRAGDWEGMRRVFRECVLPVFADESCLVEEDVPRCAGFFHGINIKLTKAGGLTPARRMIARARELGLRVMVGCMNESSVGISAIGQLLPLLDHVDMDGAVLIARDVATGVHLNRGRPVFPEENGNGVRLMAA